MVKNVKKRLEEQGGIVTKREVKLLNSTAFYTEKEKD